MVKTLGRCSSKSDALLPSDFALTNSALAASRSLIRAITTRLPTVIFMPLTDALVDAGKT